MSPIKLKGSNPKPWDNPGGKPSRTLIYLPIVHTQADMGVLQDSVSRATLERSGRAGLTRKKTMINKAWTEIEKYLNSLDLAYDRVRIYQDGLPVCGREIDIVTDLAKGGSRNHELLLQLMAKGAILMGTESGELLLQEYQLAKQALTVRPARAAGVKAQRQSANDFLLEQRDKFIAQRINDTLEADETAILFIGMLHSPARYLDPDIKVVYPFHRPQ